MGFHKCMNPDRMRGMAKYTHLELILLLSESSANFFVNYSFLLLIFLFISTINLKKFCGSCISIFKPYYSASNPSANK
jgi:hypothetical protein